MAQKSIFRSWFFLAGLLVSCQNYQPATSSVCAAWCQHMKECAPKEYAASFSHERQCQIACENQWLFMNRNETPACENSTKNLSTCLVELSCEDFSRWKDRSSDEDYQGPCRNETVGLSVYCNYECTRDDHCAGWEFCDSGSCEPRPCDTAKDCPDGIWCTEGVCQPL